MDAFIRVFYKYMIVYFIFLILGRFTLYSFYIFRDMELYDVLSSVRWWLQSVCQVVIAVMLYVDFNRLGLRYKWLACITGLFAPLMGFVMLGLFMLTRETGKSRV